MCPVVLVSVLDGVDVVLDHGVAVVVVVLHRVHALVLESAVRHKVGVGLGAVDDVGPRLPLGRFISGRDVEYE